jgi:hypothetical protein
MFSLPSPTNLDLPVGYLRRLPIACDRGRGDHA